jgi:PAS domain S-box-containing protein
METGLVDRRMAEAVRLEAPRHEAPGSIRLESARPAAGPLGAQQWEILERIARGTSLSDLLLSIVAMVEHQADEMLCSILLYDAPTKQLRHGAARRLPPELSRFIDGTTVGPHEGSCGSAAFLRQRVIVTDIATHPSWAAYKEPFLARGLHACWSTPILSPSGELLGTLAMYFTERRGPTPDENAWSDAATHLASIALSRAQAERENERLLATLEERVKELTLLHRSARLLQAPKHPLAEQLRALVSMIPTGWRFPDLCRARILHAGTDLRTPGYVETAWKLAASAPAGEHDVSIEVVYLREVPAAGSSVFLPEEQQLLESVADLLGAHLEKRQAEVALEATLSELRDKNQRLEFNVSRMPLGYVVWDRNRIITEWNGSAAGMFGLSAEAVVGKHSSELCIFPEHEPHADPLGRDLTAENGGRGVHEHVHADGSRVVCEWLHAPLTDAAGQVIGYLSMVHDITERKHAEEERTRLEAQLRQAHRIQALGTLAGGIAHDFNNILTAISGHTHLGLNDLEEERSPLDSLLAIQEASSRAVELVRRILMFSRFQHPERRTGPVAPIVQEASELSRELLTPGVTLTHKFDPAVPLVSADPTQVRQVVLNLLANAAYAVGTSGEIEVSVDAVSARDETLAGVIEPRHPRYVRITVKDSGVGMDEATLERIFEPFFTTKPTGQGTGLGLSVVHGVVKAHEGAVSVQSQPGAGSVFRIFLPALEQEQPRASSPVHAIPEGGGARVMYVDDEEPLVVLATRWLGRMGYKVTGFSDSAQALEAFRARPHDFDAVISDFSMPGLSGLDLLREVVAIRKDVVVVMSSGYLRLEDNERARQLGAVDVVLKPQSMAEFGRILHRILSERQARRAGT